MNTVEIIEALVIFFGIWINVFFALALIVRPLHSVKTTIVLRNQSVYDSFVCLCTFLLIVLPPFKNSTNNIPLDIIICHLWSSHFIQYIFVMASTSNVVFTTIDRYFAIMQPFLYRGKHPRYIMGMYIYILIVSIVIPFPKVFEVKMYNRTCIIEKTVDGSPQLNTLMNSYSIIWAIMIYFFPSIYFCVAYWKVIKKLRTLVRPFVTKGGVTGRSSAARNVTIAIFFVTAVYMATYTFDTTLYLLDQWRVISPLKGTTLDHVKTFILTLNSFINPEMYFCLLKQFRYRVYSLCIPHYKHKY